MAKFRLTMVIHLSSKSCERCSNCVSNFQALKKVLLNVPASLNTGGPKKVCHNLLAARSCKKIQNCFEM